MKPYTKDFIARLKHALQGLALPEEAQEQWLPDTDGAVYKLVAEYRRWHECFIGRDDVKTTPEQREALDKLAAPVKAVWSATDGKIWGSAEFAEIRSLAGTALESFAWPHTTPPVMPSMHTSDEPPSSNSATNLRHIIAVLCCARLRPGMYIGEERADLAVTFCGSLEMAIKLLVPLSRTQAGDGYYMQAKRARGWTNSCVARPWIEWSEGAVVDEIFSIQIAAIDLMIAELEQAAHA